MKNPDVATFGMQPKTVEEFNKYFPQPQRYSVKISAVSKHDMVRLFNEKRRFTVRGRDHRYIILSKKCFGKALYTIIDLQDRWMGPDNLVFGIYDYCNERDCEEALRALRNREIEISVRHGMSFDEYAKKFGIEIE